MVCDATNEMTVFGKAETSGNITRLRNFENGCRRLWLDMQTYVLAKPRRCALLCDVFRVAEAQAQEAAEGEVPLELTNSWKDDIDKAMAHPSDFRREGNKRAYAHNASRPHLRLSV